MTSAIINTPIEPKHGYTAKQIIEKVNATIMSTKNLAMFGGPLLTGETSLSDDIKTAATDGFNTFYNPDFMMSISMDSYGSFYTKPAVFVAMHEVGHKVLRHITTCDDLFKEDPTLANASADYAINLLLMDLIRDYKDVADVMQPPRYLDGDKKGELFMLYDEAYRGMSTRQIFAALRKKKQQQQQQQQQGQGQGQQQPQPGQGQPQPQQPQPGQGQGQPQGQPQEGVGGTGQAKTPMEQEIEDKSWDEHDRQTADGRTPEEKAKVEKAIDQAVRQSAKIAGRLGGDVHQAFELVEPDVDWEEALDSFFKDNCGGDDEATYRVFNRKVLHLGLYQPTFYTEKAGRIGLFVDTSGSTTGTLLNKFMSNTAAICEQVRPEELLLAYWDTRICAVELYREGEYDQLVESTKPVGGGGTTPKCIPPFLASGGDGEYDTVFDCIVIFTDGVGFQHSQGDWSSVTVPVLWCVIDDGSGHGGKKFTPDYGVKVNVSL